MDTTSLAIQNSPSHLPRITTARCESASAAAERLRGKAEQWVGTTFYGQLLKSMRNSPLKGPYGHGGRGEEIFGAQLDMQLARRAGSASRSPIVDAIVDRYVKYVRPESTATGTEADR